MIRNLSSIDPMQKARFEEQEELAKKLLAESLKHPERKIKVKNFLDE